MLYKHFRLVCTTRILLLGATIYLFFYLLQNSEYPATTLVVALLGAYQIWALIHYVERTNRDLGRFFLSIKYADFSQTFVTGGLGSSFDELKNAFNEVLDAFRSARAEKEEHARYLQTVVQHVGVALIAYDADGRVELVNNAAKRLLKVNRLRHVDDLTPLSADLVQTLRTLGPRQKALVRIEEENDVLQVAVYASVFRLRDREYTLASLQNIQSELEEREMEAWQNLIRVLTHEIMNSITPISSLAATASDLLGTDHLDEEDIPDVREAVQTIHRRSEGLLHFVDAYRDLTRLPSPEFQIFPVAELFSRVEQLMASQIRDAGAELHSAIDPPSLELTADSGLVEQVLINLVRNAVDAVSAGRRGRIELRAHTDGRGRTLVDVVDDGPGIVEEAMSKIFIPFFTTKQEGSGIGLSLCRQVMRLHGGTITARSRPGEKTVFSLRF